MISAENIGEVLKFRLARSILGRGLYYTAAYWVDGLMIDTGCFYTVSELVSALQELKVERIVNTHSHEDHIGANAALTKSFGAEILAHPLAIPVLAMPRDQKHLNPYQVVMWGYPESSSASPISETIETLRHSFSVIHTPGHSLDHISLYEPDEGWLFSGDTYIGGKDRALRADYNIWQIIASLKQLSLLDINLIFTGSGNVRKNGSAALKEKITYLESTGEQTLELHSQGLSYRQIRQKLFGREMLIAYVTLGHFTGKQLVRSFIEDRPSTQQCTASCNGA
jgi:glyoxylase-like metal-dependent hydrolase (beta-lactamase superfamily II)